MPGSEEKRTDRRQRQVNVGELDPFPEGLRLTQVRTTATTERVTQIAIAARASRHSLDFLLPRLGFRQSGSGRFTKSSIDKIVLFVQH